MADPEFEGSMRALRLAQQLAQSITTSEVPPEEWSQVLQFLKAMIARKDEPPQQGTSQLRDDVEKH